MEHQDPAYQLQVSRIFDAPPPVVRRAFTDPDLRSQWVPASGRPVPDPVETPGDESLAWAEQPAPGRADAGLAAVRTVRVMLYDEPGGKTRLELRAGPYSEAEEDEARAWWNRAFSHIDTVAGRIV